jgi:hypothetical protein
MRVVLDECIPRKAKHCLSGFLVSTVPEQGWAGLTNGKLLAAITGHFDFFVTVDRNLQFQQRIANLPFGIIIVAARSNRFEHLRPHIEQIPPLLVSSNLGKILSVP